MSVVTALSTEPRRAGESAATTLTPEGAAFARDGYLGPLPLFTRAEVRRIAGCLRREDHPAPADWPKGRAVHERFLYELAVHPPLLSRVRELLGDDVVLWGASTVAYGPGARHAWHTDIESSAPGGRFVTAWIGVEHTSHESALQLITGSHRLGLSLQEARVERGLERGLATAEDVLALARLRDPAARLLHPDMGDGDALLFDGRTWHGSHNARRSGTRVALLLQYASAEEAVLIPDPHRLDWPFRFREAPRPAVILVSGSDRHGRNRIVPPPPMPRTRAMTATLVHRFDLPFDGTSAFRSSHAFRGPTSTVADMSCHASVLGPGESPHPPHVHPEEEILVPLQGEVELVIARSPDDPSPRLERIQPGSFVYYPAGQHHTIHNRGTSPVAYLMFKWLAAPSGARAPLETSLFHFGDAVAPRDAPSYWTRLVFQHPTAMLGRLHAHVSVVQPGGGYAPHLDAHDVAIVPLTGTIETLGRTVVPFSVVYCAAGEPHGMRNPGPEAARYLVFEFHAPGVAPLAPPPPLGRRMIRLAKNLARPLWHRVRRLSG